MHTFAHIEFPTLDVRKAVEFYGPLFNWTFRKFYGDDYLLICTSEGETIGGLTRVSEIPRISGFYNYVEVADVDSALKKAEKLGGSVSRLSSELPDGMGCYGVILSPDGYPLGIWSKTGVAK
ncbi:VOC family protein [bacterium]|nr:VOC family protein [bacterium]MBU1984199.1 VOC family protein [bacterium]